MFFFGNYCLNCFEIKFSSVKTATVYYEKPFKVPSGIIVKIITNVINNDNIEYKTIATVGKVVPACTPCFLESDEAKTYQFWFDETNTDKAPQPNYLWGTTTSIHAYKKFPQDKYKIYKLSFGVETKELGWYLIDPTKDVLLPNKSILVKPK